VERALDPVIRSNWHEVIDLQLRPEQLRFVATPLFSLAAAWVRRWGNQYIYAPSAICRTGAVVGYVCTVCNPDSSHDFWIDDILIEAKYQGRGYGRIALSIVIGSILQAYKTCAAVKLHCHPENRTAAHLYLNMGFRLTGAVDSNNGNEEYELSGTALNRYARE
jgi:diamine N-acetyltransferase